MSDPLAFDIRRVSLGPVCVGGEGAPYIHCFYPLLDGCEIRERLELSGADVQPWDRRRAEAWLRLAYAQTLSEMSAHQPLAWLAAARAHR